MIIDCPAFSEGTYPAEIFMMSFLKQTKAMRVLTKDESKKEATKPKEGNQLSQESSNKKFVKIGAGITGAATGVPILDSVAANDLQHKEVELANQRINMNHAMDANDALNREKEKTDKQNKDLSQNL